MSVEINKRPAITPVDVIKLRYDELKLKLPEPPEDRNRMYFVDKEDDMRRKVEPPKPAGSDDLTAATDARLKQGATLATLETSKEPFPQLHEVKIFDKTKLSFPFLPPQNVNVTTRYPASFKVVSQTPIGEGAKYTIEVTWRINDGNSDHTETFHLVKDQANSVVKLTFRGKTYTRQEMFDIICRRDKLIQGIGDPNTGGGSADVKVSDNQELNKKAAEEAAKEMAGKSPQVVRLPHGTGIPLTPLERDGHKAKAGETPTSKVGKLERDLSSGELAQKLGLTPAEAEKLPEGTTSYLVTELTWKAEDGTPLTETIYTGLDSEGKPSGVTIARNKVYTSGQLAELENLIKLPMLGNGFGAALTTDQATEWARRIYNALDRRFTSLWFQSESKALLAAKEAVEAKKWQETKSAFANKYKTEHGGDLNRFFSHHLRLIQSETGAYVDLLWGKDVGKHLIDIWACAQGQTIFHTVNSNLVDKIKQAAGWDEATQTCKHPERLQKIVRLWSHVYRCQESDNGRDFYAMLEANLGEDDDLTETGVNGQKITYRAKVNAILKVCGADQESMMTRGQDGKWQWNEKSNKLIKEPE